MADDPLSGGITPDEIEALLKQAESAAAPAATVPAAAPPPAAPAADDAVSQADIELLLQQAEQALASVEQPTGQAPSGARPFALPEFNAAPAAQDNATLELLRDVELDLKIELGRTQMYLEDVLKLRKGSVVSLDKLAGDPVDVYVNGRLIARGEVLVLNDNFCVRVAELVAGEKQ